MVEFASGLEGLSSWPARRALRGADPNLLDLIVELLSSATERILAAGCAPTTSSARTIFRRCAGGSLPDRQTSSASGSTTASSAATTSTSTTSPITSSWLSASPTAAGSRRSHGYDGGREAWPRCSRTSATRARLTVARTGRVRLQPPQRALPPRARPGWMVLRERRPRRGARERAAPGRSFLIDMNTLFERFSNGCSQFVLKPVRDSGSRQQSDSIFWRPDLRRVTRGFGRTPPCSGQGAARAAPLDAKYKRYDSDKVDVGDLTQVFLYAYAYRQTPATEARARPLTRARRRASPCSSRSGHSVAERGVDAELAVLGVHIPTVLAEVKLGWGPALEALRVLLLAQLPSAAITVGAPLAAADAGASASLPA